MIGGHEVIVADPPWKFASNSEAKPSRNAMRHYRCMRDDAICALPVRDWVAPAALLFMWTTAPMLERSMAIPKAWGFKYVSQLIWVKNRVATGYWVRNRHEIVLVAKRGRFPCPSPAPFADSVLTGAQREHSQKPDSLQDRIDEVWPDAPKLELFARRERPGWTSWGNETDKYNEG